MSSVLLCRRRCFPQSSFPAYLRRREKLWWDCITISFPEPALPLSWCSPKGSQPLGTRLIASRKKATCKKPRSEWKRRIKMQVTSLLLWLLWSLFHIFCILYLVDLSGFSCSVLALCVNTCTFACSVTDMSVLSTQAMWNRNVLEKSDVGHLLEKAMQFSVPWWSIWCIGAEIK